MTITTKFNLRDKVLVTMFDRPIYGVVNGFQVDRNGTLLVEVCYLLDMGAIGTSRFYEDELEPGAG